MGSNMQRQAVSLLTPQRAFVGTGLEARVTHDSGAVARIRKSAYVLYADSQRIDVLTEKSVGRKSPNEPSFERETIALTTYQRSNQDTCMHQRPSVVPNTWVHAGECLADTASTVAGELALGKNILVAYMPWEGYNFEDAVLVSERLVFEDVFTSVHIERYDISTSRTRDGQEYITSKVEKNMHLDQFGVIKVGTWVEPGDILVGKVSPQQESENTPEGRLLRAIFGGATRDVKDTPLVVPSGVTGRVLECRTLFETTKYNEELDSYESVGSVHIFLVQKRKVQVGDKIAGRHGNKGIISNILPRQDMPFLQNGTPVDMVLNPLGVPSRMNVGQIFECLLGLAAHTLEQNYKVLPFDEMHGDEVSRGFVYQQLYKARCATNQKWVFRPESPGKSILFDGRTGYPFDQPVTVGYPYILKLVHLVDDKIHARSTGPYSLVTQQPLGGRSKHGGQRLGEMEVWALEGFGAAYTLQELLTIKSDDMRGRNLAFMSIIRGNLLPKPGVPESFKVLVCELRGLCLDISLSQIPSN
jgi:DNA-directed RNA polymerase subunit beta